MRDNPYPGINAHLNSLLQTRARKNLPSGWHAFHQQHIAHIVDALNEQLPDHYIAFNEQSLQTRSHDEDESEEVSISIPKPDVSVFQQREGMVLTSAVAATPTWEATLSSVVQPVKQPRAVVIRDQRTEAEFGTLVARIELLSPANKPRGRHNPTYKARRLEALESDVPLIEIDYLHETPPILLQLPIYPHAEDSYPYMILVSDPRPDWAKGTVKVYGFRVGEPLKPFVLPLAGDESLVFDLTSVYQRTFKAGRWGDLLDYSVNPARFETYNGVDQSGIQKMMEKPIP